VRGRDSAGRPLSMRYNSVQMTDSSKAGSGSQKVFLCHSSGDKEAVRRLYRTLRRAGIDPWLDEEDLVGGQDWGLEIPRALRNSAAVIVCLSTEAITKTGYVHKEVKVALEIADQQPEGQIFIIPVRLDDCSMPERLMKWQRVDLFKPDGETSLLRALNKRGLVQCENIPESKLRLTVHRAYFLASGAECFFLNATNIGIQEELEITHVWLETDPPFYVLQPDRPLPKRLMPQETWETWVRVHDLRSRADQDVFTSARARLSTGVVIRSIKNEGVPPVGTVPGGPISRI
jgi:hypothetical protein